MISHAQSLGMEMVLPSILDNNSNSRRRFLPRNSVFPRLLSHGHGAGARHTLASGLKSP